MKKKVLFVMNSLNCGGAEKSLISLLETIDYTKFEVDLYLFKHQGIFLRKLPKQVNLLKEPEEFKYFDMPIKKAIYCCVKNRRLNIVISRIQAGYIFRNEINRARCDQRVWKYISGSLNNLNKKYHVAIGYLERSPIYFIINKVKADKKIGWIHTNYSNSGMDKKIDNSYFQELNHIVTVSQECKRSLVTHFPSYSHKVKVINNIVSSHIVQSLSKEELYDNYETDDNTINIVTVARLCQVKGIDMAIEACKILINRGYKIRWRVLGTGTPEENESYKSMIKKNNLQNEFTLLGVKDNPYPYIKKADIYVQPSRFEGKSIAVEEAKILHKPIVVTNFTTAKDQVDNMENGLIVNMDYVSIADGIQRIIKEENLKNKFIVNLSNEHLGNENEVEKLYKLI
ncbi:glycosyltransferase [Pseudalkalibacillus caeni]|uniref:Glycosyltransferase n=1 Tax=Exobacillus caeni TaxID=2574798 RepID=A0A5R9EZ79_9BACL|nr:glycosyltransferase [Pseudalkalibacillus caeni]TLS35769.1 glycosyltransferase [Pseudalkalibacillus caeni]